MNSVPLKDAQQIAQAILDHARAESAAPLSVAVLDAGGHLQVMLREDGAGFLRMDIAVAKAWGALGMTQPSAQLASRAANQPTFFSSLVEISHGRLALAPGGILLASDAGDLIGAVGVSGDTAEVDERCAISAVEQVGYRVLGLD